MRKRLADSGQADSVTLEQARKKAKAYFAAADSKAPQSGIDDMRVAATTKELATSTENSDQADL